MKPKFDFDVQELDQSRFSIVLHEGTPTIAIDKKVPLWRAGVPMDEVTIALYTPSKKDRSEGETYMLMCKDQCGDIFTYGDWETLNEADDWLKNPIALY